MAFATVVEFSVASAAVAEFSVAFVAWVASVVISVVTAPNSIEFSVSTVSSVMTSSNLVEFSVASAALLVFSMSSVSSAALLGGFRGLRDDLRTWVNFL